MNLISEEIVEHLKEGSWIKDLFEKGSQLKQIYSDDMIFDFSLGNPIIEPPTNFKTKLKELVINSPGNVHGYLSNQGLIGAREKIASFLADLYKHHFYQESIVITTGASGALNVALKSILNPNDEVIVLVPYFVEYKYYIRNAQGIPIYCNLDNDFQIDCDEISSKITARTKAIIINTP
ncbi:aminotransferase class I/II-fold pyridoxal phosphate-dependent enzyme, partial [Lysinibacillus boronitolerans]|uniref:aminotransferase class I/II-fold pyridoxal phosphate-dependent enzyme n=1 Tax=Lysinibacillus boronitolerans TaxID=309788 RepID=UPI0003704CA8